MALEMKYFVLKPRGVDRHAMASRIAMRVYAKLFRDYDPELATSMEEWVNKETPEVGI